MAPAYPFLLFRKFEMFLNLIYLFIAIIVQTMLTKLRSFSVLILHLGRNNLLEHFSYEIKLLKIFQLRS